MQKEARVELRLPTIEKEQWEQAARAEGFKSLSAYVRAKVSGERTRLTPVQESQQEQPVYGADAERETAVEYAHRLAAERRAARSSNKETV